MSQGPGFEISLPSTACQLLSLFHTFPVSFSITVKYSRNAKKTQETKQKFIWGLNIILPHLPVTLFILLSDSQDIQGLLNLAPSITSFSGQWLSISISSHNLATIIIIWYINISISSLTMPLYPMSPSVWHCVVKQSPLSSTADVQDALYHPDQGFICWLALFPDEALSNKL